MAYPRRDRKQIDKVEFRKKAREFASKFIEIQKKDFIRLGVWRDWDKSYMTMTNEYEATIVRIFRMLVEKGYIYRSKKPIHWCINCETALADAEARMTELPRCCRSRKASSARSALELTLTDWTSASE